MGKHALRWPTARWFSMADVNLLEAVVRSCFPVLPQGLWGPLDISISYSAADQITNWRVLPIAKEHRSRNPECQIVQVGHYSTESSKSVFIWPADRAAHWKVGFTIGRQSTTSEQNMESRYQREWKSFWAVVAHFSFCIFFKYIYIYITQLFWPSLNSLNLNQLGAFFLDRLD